MYMHGGLHGAAVETILGVQKALKAKGFDPGKLDGIMGPKTKAAIINFQKANGLAADGIVGPKTSAKLFTAAAPMPNAALMQAADAVAPFTSLPAAIAKGTEIVVKAVHADTAAKASKNQAAADTAKAVAQAAMDKLFKRSDDTPLPVGAGVDKNASPAPPYSPPTILDAPPVTAIAPSAPAQDFLIPVLIGAGALLLLTMGRK